MTILRKKKLLFKYTFVTPVRGIFSGVRKWVLGSHPYGMDRGSDLISDFRARRIRTPITWEILSANCHEVTEFRITGSGSAGAGSGNEP
jgi:hypothetical protein